MATLYKKPLSVLICCSLSAPQKSFSKRYTFLTLIRSSSLRMISIKIKIIFNQFIGYLGLLYVYQISTFKS
ncbi:hypothetical protein NBO_44g0007 [Nosema bombycis CQ1]|uniref:Uncharacterized protein n=1 Tax=Nosema bombycis (strain CQ1 / CVCC 102059) TaxID=578461 RepID=R0M7M6_NOSB1|nr:hypothetical protein NBO_44g0007 [Nosema bombycis CQ1]|eukprot:EOB13989.1 hypothetical protein NBO_44g0007 [Nosema bombycis CQ1]